MRVTYRTDERRLARPAIGHLVFEVTMTLADSFVARSMLVLSVAGLAGCADGDEASVDIVGVFQNAYVGGPQRTKLAADSSDGLVRAELYLDGARVAEDALAPFELVWDARDFAAGPHILEGRLYTGTDSWLFSPEVPIRIDNDPPELEVFGSFVLVGQTLVVQAQDSGLLARVELLVEQAGPQPFVDTVAPYGFAWSWCGATPVTVTALDAAGNATIIQKVVNGALTVNDLDCDGHDAGGDDCNDNDPTVYWGAPEPGDGRDHDCDGEPNFLVGERATST